MRSLPAFWGLVGSMCCKELCAGKGEAAQSGTHFGDHGAVAPGVDLILLACWEDHESTLEVVSTSKMASGVRELISACGRNGVGVIREARSTGPPSLRLFSVAHH